MRNFVLAFALGFGVSGAANAADVNVAPGLGTLNAAIVAAADGDTLFLQDGTYRMLGTTIAKNLTIKAQTNNAPVIVPDTNTGTNRAIRLGNATAEISVSFVGVHLSAIDISVVPGDDVDLTVVESTWSGYPNSITDSSDLLDDLVLIGNTFTSSHWNFDANKLIIAGNTFNLPSQTTFGHINVTSRHTSHFVGNEVNSAHHYRTGMLTLFGESHFVLANRFRTDLSVGDVGTSTQDQQYTVIFTSPDNS